MQRCQANTNIKKAGVTNLLPDKYTSKKQKFQKNKKAILSCQRLWFTMIHINIDIGRDRNLCVHEREIRDSVGKETGEGRKDMRKRKKINVI